MAISPAEQFIGPLKNKVKALKSFLGGRMALAKDTFANLPEMTTNGCYLTIAKELADEQSFELKDIAAGRLHLVKIVEAPTGDKKTLSQQLLVSEPANAVLVADPKSQFAAELVQRCLRSLSIGQANDIIKPRYGSHVRTANLPSWQHLEEQLYALSQHLKIASKVFGYLDILREWMVPDQLSSVADGESTRLIIGGVWLGTFELAALLRRLEIPVSACGVLVEDDHRCYLIVIDCNSTPINHEPVALLGISA